MQGIYLRRVEIINNGEEKPPLNMISLIIIIDMINILTLILYYPILYVAMNGINY